MVRKPKIAIREFSQSFARPWLMKLDDNRESIVKFFVGSNGISLVNEWMCAKIAKRLGLPVVDFDLVEIDSDFINKTTDLVARLITPGKHFATTFINGSTNLNDEIAKGIELKKISNAEKIPGMIVFDIFVNNTDRSHNNSLIAPAGEGLEKYNYYLIDHGHCFGGPNWTEQSLEALPISECNVPWNTDGITGIESFTPTIEALKSLKKNDYQAMAEPILNEWNVSPANISKLIEILVNRDKDRILTILEGMSKTNNRFQNWR